MLVYSQYFPMSFILNLFPEIPSNDKYQPHVDGLRAVAVLSVIFFHLGVKWAPGGYVGVDIFFVISGYLITRLINVEIDTTGSFNFIRFYIRRMRRLFPALITTLLVCVFCIKHFLLDRKWLLRSGCSDKSATSYMVS